MNRFAMIVVMAIILAVNTVQAASKYFTCGAGTNAWNTSSSFWGTTSGGPYNTTWSANDDAFFEGTAGGVNLSAVQTANSVTFRIAGYTITNGTLILASPAMISNEVAATISSVIDGSSGMTKAGLGILVLSNNAVANTYVGDTVINGGTLSLVGSAVAGGTNKLASGTIYVNPGAALYLGGMAQLNWGAGTPSVVLNGGTLGMSDGQYNYVKNITFTNGSTWVLGTGSLINGLTGANFSLATIVSKASSDASTITSRGGAISAASGVIANVERGTAGADLVISACLADYSGTPGSFTKNGAGIVTLTASNAYTGATTVNGGTLNLSYNSVGAGALGGGTLTINQGASVVATVTNALGYSGSNWTRNININFGTLSTSIAGADNAYGTTINLTGGNLSSSVSDGYFAMGAGLSAGYGATINVNATNVASVISADLKIRDTAPAGLLFNVARGSGSADLNISGKILNQSTGGITLTGNGITQLGGANNYNGTTTINGGVLLVNGTNSCTGATTVNAGTLGGSGVITGAVIVASGAHLAPGVGVGMLTAGTLTLAAGSLMDVEFNGGPGNDKLLVTKSGGLSLNGVAVNVVNEGTNTAWTTDGMYNLISYSNSIAGAGVGSLWVSNAQASKNYLFGTSNGWVTLTISAGQSGSWNGSGGDDNWATGGNWIGGVAPAAGNALVFGDSGAVRLSNTNNFASNTRFAGITFSNSTYTLNGNGVKLVGDIVNTTSSVQTMNVAVLWDAGIHTVNVLDGAITMNGVISSTNAMWELVKAGPGALTFAAANTFSGTTAIGGGTLTLAHALALQASTLDYGNYGGVLSFGSLTNATLGGLTGNQDLALANESAAAVALLVSNNTVTTYSGSLSGGGSLIRSGSGTFTLTGSGTNTYSGPTVIGSSGYFALNKVAGVVAIPGDIVITNTSSARLYMLTDNQLGGNGVLTFVGAGGNARVELGNTAQSVAGIVEANGVGVIQHQEQTAANTTGTGMLTLTGAGNYSFNGYLRNQVGTLAVTKTGAGTQTLSGANITYGGTTIVSNGVLSLRDTTAFASPLTMTSGGTLALNRTANGFASRSPIAAGALTGSGVININNTASLTTGGWIYVGTASGWNFSGTINVNSGVLTRDNTTANNITGSATINVAPGGIFGTRGGGVVIGALSGAGEISPLWSSANATTLTLGNGDGSGNFTGIIHGNGSSATDGNIEGGTLALVKIGVGTQILGGINTYTGSTTISNGTLVVNGSLAAASAVTVTSGATLGGTGTVAGVVTANAGSTLSPGNSVGTLKVGSLVLNPGCTNVFEFNATPTNDLIVVTTSGGLTVNGGSVLLYQEGTTNALSTPGTYVLMTYSGSLNGSGALQVANPLPGLAYAFSFSGNTLKLTITSGGKVWTGGGTSDGNWTTGDNWGGIAPVQDESLVFGGEGAARLINNNDFPANTRFGGMTFANGAYTLGGSTVNLGGDIVNTTNLDQTINLGLVLDSFSRIFDTGPGSITVSAAIGTTNGSWGISKAGSGTLSLGGPNTYTGPTTVNAGTVKLVASEVIPDSSAVAIASGATLDVNGQAETIGVMTGSGAVTLGSGALTVSSSTNSVFSGILSGTGGALTKAGSGTLTLSGANTYSGGSTLSAGTLALGSSGAVGTNGTISLGGGVLQHSAANTNDYSARFSSAAGQAYKLDTAGQTVTLASALTSSGGTLTKLGTGTVILTGANSYSGGTIISAGVVQIGGTAGTLGSGPVAIGGNTLQINRSNAATVTNDLSGTGTVEKYVANVSTYGGTSTLTGTVQQKTEGGTFTLAPGASMTGLATVNQDGNLSTTWNVNGTLSAANFYGANVGANFTSKTVTFNVNAGGAATIGTMSISTMGWVQDSNPTTTINVNSGAVLTATTIQGQGNGGGSVGYKRVRRYINVTGGRLNATTINLSAGGTGDYVNEVRRVTLNNGTLANISGGNLTVDTTTTIMLTANGIFDVDAGRTITASGTVTSSGGLTKTGSGTLTLSGVNSFTGATTVNNGTLRLNNVQLAGSVAITLNGGTFMPGALSNAVSQSSLMVLNGGTLDASSATYLAGRMGVGTNSGTILMGPGLQFVDSSTNTWAGGMVNLVGTLGTNTLRFGTSRTGLTPDQKHSMSWQGRGVTLNDQGYVVLTTGTLIMVQ